MYWNWYINLKVRYSKVGIFNVLIMLYESVCFVNKYIRWFEGFERKLELGF